MDEIEVAVMPVLLGSGVPLAGAAGLRSRLRLTGSDALPSGIVNLRYDIHHATGE